MASGGTSASALILNILLIAALVRLWNITLKPKETLQIPPLLVICSRSAVYQVPLVGNPFSLSYSLYLLYNHRYERVAHNFELRKFRMNSVREKFQPHFHFVSNARQNAAIDRSLTSIIAMFVYNTVCILHKLQTEVC